ncbi:MAG: DUF47 family protein [Bacteroidota bacterium]|nr:DUF47 family protein [Bacteroidota bacterium]
MTLLQKLLPKEEKYFEHFNDMIAHIREMAEAAHAFLSEHPYDPELLLKLKPLEVRCDEINHKVVKHLNKTFVTPFDREDILALIQRLDDISDTLLGACIRVEIFKLTEPIEGAEKLTRIVLRQIQELESAIRGIKDKRDTLRECKTVKDLEREADNVYQYLTTRLFEEERDAITLIKKKEILEILENASDRCQAVASTITSIVIKSA